MSGSRSNIDPVADAIAVVARRLSVDRESITVINTSEKLVIEFSEATLIQSKVERKRYLRILRGLETRLRENTGREVIATVVKYEGRLLAIEQIVYQELRELLPEKISRVFLVGLEAPQVDVIVEFSLELPAADLPGLLAHAAKPVSHLLSLVSLEMRSIAPYERGRPPPSQFAILTTIKSCQPCLCVEIERSLIQRGFAVESNYWLSHQLDSLRKHSLLIRSSSDERYRLTVNGLRAIPASKGRDSTDVIRALALRKRKW